MRVCAAGVLVKGDSVLLGLRSKDTSFYPDTWDVFGGHCEEGESIEQTLVRELDEELGVRAQHFEPLGVFEEPDPDRHGPGRYHFFAIYQWTGEPVNLGNEHQRIQWFRVGELDTVKLASALYRQLFSSL